MKNKDANFFQLHVEKIVLGIGVLILLIVLAVFVVGHPYAVELQGQSVSPAQAPKVVVTAAKHLDEALKNGGGIKIGATPDYAGQFNGLVSTPVTAPTQLAMIGHPGLSSDIGPAGHYPTYAMAYPPVTTDPIAESGYGALGAVGNASLQQQLIQLIGAQNQPYDFRYVSVAATFDLGQWKKEFNDLPADSRPPRKWFLPTIAGVYLERQQIDQQTGDDIGKPVIIQPLPGQLGFTDAQQNWTVAQAQQNIQAVKQNQPAVARAAFVPLANAGQWRPPAIAPPELTRREESQLKNARQQYKMLRHQQDMLYQQITRLMNEANGGNNNNGFGPGGGQANMNTGNLSPQLQQSLDTINRRLHEVQIQMYRQLGTMYGLMGIPGQPPEPPGGLTVSQTQRPQPTTPTSAPPLPIVPPSSDTGDLANMAAQQAQLAQQRQMQQAQARARQRMQQQQRLTQFGNPNRNQRKLPQLNPGQWRVWAHDLTAQPGQTYKYRVIVTVLNPLFHRRAVAKKQWKENYHRFALAPSEQELATAGKSSWTKPVTIDPDFYFFLVSGSPQTDAARVQVWRIYDGVWRDGTFAEKPGDPIGGDAKITLAGGIDQSISLNVGDLMVDLAAAGDNSTGQDVRLLFLNSQTGHIGERMLNHDRASGTLIRLENQQAMAKQLAQMFGQRGNQQTFNPYASPEQRQQAGAQGGGQVAAYGYGYGQGNGGSSPYTGNGSNPYAANSSGGYASPGGDVAPPSPPDFVPPPG